MDLILMLPRELARLALLAAVATTKYLSTRKDLIIVQFNYHVLTCMVLYTCVTRPKYSFWPMLDISTQQAMATNLKL